MGFPKGTSRSVTHDEAEERRKRHPSPLAPLGGRPRRRTIPHPPETRLKAVLAVEEVIPIDWSSTVMRIGSELKAWKKVKGIERAAYHEAGHAVASRLLHRAFKYVSIELEGDSVGRLISRKCSIDWDNDQYDDSARARNRRDQLVMISLAGLEAEKIFCRRYNWRGSDSDIHASIEMLLSWCGSAEQTSAYVEWLRIRAKGLMQYWFGAVYVLAQELLKKRRIGAKDAYILIDKAMKDRDLIDSYKGGNWHLSSR